MAAALPWHPSESLLHTQLLPSHLLPSHDNPTQPFLTPQAAAQLARSPLLAVGTVDGEGRVWTSLWGGKPGFAVPVGGGCVGVRVGICGLGDGVVSALVGDAVEERVGCGGDASGDGNEKQEEETSFVIPKGKMMSALAIDPDARRRVKLFGRVVAGRVVIPPRSAFSATNDSNGDGGRLADGADGTISTKEGHLEDQAASVQLILHVSQSLGNCPKYITRRVITPAPFPQHQNHHHDHHPQSSRQHHQAQQIEKQHLKADNDEDSAHLSAEAISLIHKSDTFFISTAHADDDMDTNHRGGAAGFARVSRDLECGRGGDAGDGNGNVDGKNTHNMPPLASSTAASTAPNNDGQNQQKLQQQNEDPWTITWPEYSGNRLYQTLGNLGRTPTAGLCFPDFDTGDVLYVTGSTRTLMGKDASAVISRSNLAVVLSVERAVFVQQGLGFRGEGREESPYNPKVRLLAREISGGGVTDLVSNKNMRDEQSTTKNTAKFLHQTRLTPTISRFVFSLSNPSASTYSPGQWMALDFSTELDEGYSHMRDDDPKSINDDYVRTFTVSSPPPPRTVEGKGLADDEVEITVRRVGVVTGWLGRQVGGRGTEIPVMGFGGSFSVMNADGDGGVGGGGLTSFVAGGVGITPLLACLPSLDVKRLRLFWTLTVEDVGLVKDVLGRHPELARVARIFLTGSAPAGVSTTEGEGEGKGGQAKTMQEIRAKGARCEMRRMVAQDLATDDSSMSRRWYVCAGTGLRQRLLEWLEGREVMYEDFIF